MMFRVCERFGRAPSWFAAQPYGEQLRLLAYEQLREREEGAAFCPFLGGA